MYAKTGGVFAPPVQTDPEKGQSDLKEIIA